jgi:hypothetical protein
MQHVVLSLADGLYLFFIIVTFVCLATRRDALLPTLIGLFLTGLALKEGNLLGGVLVTYKAILLAGTDLLNMIMIIASITTLTKVMADMGVDQIMVAPAKKLLQNPLKSFIVLSIVILPISWVLRATPAVVLIGTLLVPTAIVSGMSPVVAGLLLSILGKGVALSSDFLSQGTPAFTAKATKLPVGDVFSASIPIWATVSIVTMICLCIVARKIQKQENIKRLSGDDLHIDAYREAATTKAIEVTPVAKLMAIIIPLVILADIITMVVYKLSGDDAMALMGGTFYLVSALCGIIHYKGKSFEKVMEHARAGWMFAIKVFGPIIIISGFFWLGGQSLKTIVGDPNMQGLAFHWGYFTAEHMPINKFMVALLATVTSGLGALDGSGYAAIPIGASIAMALGQPIGANVTYLVAMAQISAIFVGATLVPWGFLAITGSVVKIDPQELARKSFIPVMVGLLVGVIVTAFLA